MGRKLSPLFRILCSCSVSCLSERLTTLSIFCRSALDSSTKLINLQYHIINSKQLQCPLKSFAGVWSTNRMITFIYQIRLYILIYQGNKFRAYCTKESIYMISHLVIRHKNISSSSCKLNEFGLTLSPKYV